MIDTTTPTMTALITELVTSRDLDRISPTITLDDSPGWYPFIWADSTHMGVTKARTQKTVDEAMTDDAPWDALPEFTVDGNWCRWSELTDAGYATTLLTIAVANGWVVLSHGAPHRYRLRISEDGGGDTPALPAPADQTYYTPCRTWVRASDGAVAIIRTASPREDGAMRGFIVDVWTGAGIKCEPVKCATMTAAEQMAQTSGFSPARSTS